MHRHFARQIAASLFLAGLFVAPAARAANVTVPIDIGLGPALHHGGGKLFDGGRQLHYGLKISAAAIISRELIAQHINRVPKGWRKMVKRMPELRMSKIYIPDTILISPKIDGTGMYGITWQLLGLGLPLYRRGTIVSLRAGLLLTAAFIHSDVLTDPNGQPVDTMLFLRPGFDAGLNVEIPITDRFLVSFGWQWQGYIPQIIGGDFLATGFDDATLANSIWSMGQAYLRFHVRFPYQTSF